ncbi:MAG: PP2C family protein-serine/threonine phosphatase [Verrucomicrobiota bacterium]
MDIIHYLCLVLVGVSSLLAGALILALINQRRRAKRLKQVLKALSGEEERMFHFLHDLGISIGAEPTDGALSRTIVEGIVDVVGASGGAIYYPTGDLKFLVPAYVSENCPPLMSLPEKVLEDAKQDERVLASHLNLDRIKLSQGLLGRAFGAAEAIHIEDLSAHGVLGMYVRHEVPNVAVMISPLRYAGQEIGVLAIAKLKSEGEFSVNDFAVFRSVAEQSAFAIGNARIHREANAKKAIEGELHNAREVQRVLLPQDDPKVKGFRIHGINLAARIISGDYYDYIELTDGKLGVVVADVSGKGVAAGLLMAMCRSLLRAVALSHSSPSKVLGAVNRYLFPDIREDMFISLNYGVLDPDTGRMTFTRAGHDPALVFRKATGEVEVLRPRGLALGIDQGDVFERVTEDCQVEMESGDCVLFFTDGVKEAMNANEEEFGMERLSKAFSASAALGAEVVVKRVQEAVENFSGECAQMDDVTIVAIEKR